MVHCFAFDWLLVFKIVHHLMKNIVFVKYIHNEKERSCLLTMGQVGIIMGSISDWETLKHTCDTLGEFGIIFEKEVMSAHRTPEDMFVYAKTAKERGISVIIAGAGGAAHLPGMVASLTTLPVIGVPIQTKALGGMDSLLSIVQMPGGVPTATMAIGKAGAINAAIFAAQIIGLQNTDIQIKLANYRKKMRENVNGMREDLANK